MKNEFLPNILNKFKDEIPLKTITKIQSLLSNNGILSYENVWNQTNNFFYSVRIEMDELPVGVNGKGTSRVFALASAYGELMERLQNRTLVRPHYGLKEKNNTFNFPDEIYPCDITDFISNVFLKNYEFIDKDELREVFRKRKSFNICRPYYNINRDTIEYLPGRFLAALKGSNGMCAGNTFSEAICHGICEIFERYVIRKIFFEDLLLPTIPLECIVNQQLYQQILYIKEKGFSIYVKDCTLNGTIPVIGLVIVNPSKTKYGCCFGSDPIFDIAVERCFTEKFQGIIHGQIEKYMLPIEWNDWRNKTFKERVRELEKFTSNLSGQLPNSIFGSSNFDKRNLKVFYDNDINKYNSKVGFNYVINLLLKYDYQIYIRDLSFFDFPTYEVYIPGMTEVDVKDSEMLMDEIYTSKAASIFFNFRNSSKEELIFLENFLEKQDVDKSKTIKDTRFYSKGCISFNNENDNPYNDLEINLFLSLLNLYLKNYSQAYQYLKNYIDPKINSNYTNIEYYMCALAYLKMKKDQSGEEDLINILIFNFGKELSDEVINDLTNDNKLFDHLDLPACPDCKNCPIQRNCLYDKWEKLDRKIVTKMRENYCDPQSLRNKLFETKEILPN